MRLTLIYNPTAGQDDHDRGSLHAVLEEHGHDVRIASVKENGWKQMLSDPGELVVVAGGDGTVRKVFKELASSGVPVTVAPVGSANNVARTLGLAERPIEELLAGVPGGERRRFEVGEAAAPWGTTPFVESFGGGLFAEVLLRAEDVEQQSDKVDLGLRLVEDSLRDLPALEWELEADGVDASGAYLAIEAMNIRETGPNIPLAPDADPGDGVLDVALIRPEDRKPLLGYIQSRLGGGRQEPPRFDVVRAGRLNARPPAGCALRVDDELWPDDGASVWRTAEVLVRTGDLAVDVIVPRTSDPGR
jgi:diacylglycerol kinase family enzyme